MTLLAIVAIANAVLSLIGVWCARGLWKLVATLPILGVFAVGLNIVLATSRDPTSHNLWPLEVVLWSGVGIIFSIAFILLRRVFFTTQTLVSTK